MPWAVSYPEAVYALLEEAPGALLVYVGLDDYDYGKLIKRLWSGESFIIVEHDIIVPPGALRELEMCARPWCAFPYMETTVGQPVTGLGLTKLAGELHGIPLWDEPLIWQNVDAGVGPRLEAAGYTVHVHETVVRNLRTEKLTNGPPLARAREGQ